MEFGTDGLEFKYVAAAGSTPESFQLTGTAFVEVGGIGNKLGGQDVSVTFGDGDADDSTDPNAGFQVGKVNFGTKDLMFVYTAATDTFQLTGTAYVDLGVKGFPADAYVDVTFANNGLLITNGNLVSIDVAVTGSFSVGPVSFSTDNLEFSYVFGGTNPDGTTTEGIVVTDGVLTTFNMTVGVNFSLAGITVNGNLVANYESSTNEFQMTGAGDPNAARMFASDVQLTETSYQIDSMLSAAGGGTTASISAHFFSNLASTIAKSGGAPLNLGDPATVQTLISATASGVNVTLDPTVAGGAATIVAGVNQYVTALPVTGSASYLNQVVQAQVVAEKTIAPLLAQATPATISSLVAQETGTALANQITGASIGSVNLDGATILIANEVQQRVGNGDPSTMQFNVYLATNTPPTKTIPVNYTTQDDTATATNGDYTPVSGKLTWRPGDTAPKTITVAVNPTSTIAADKLFKVVLSNPVNASIESAVGVGDIQYTDVATTTTLTSSAASPTVGQKVTLTATVTNQDAARDAGTGSVTFYDGTTVLGTGTLVNGVASFTTANLSTGAHAISAAYAGHLVVGEKLDSNTSAPVSVTVFPAAQTINFGALADTTYGAAPIVLNATSSSDLQVTYKILSGPARLVGGDVLTITGAGTISIEADQAGDSD